MVRGFERFKSAAEKFFTPGLGEAPEEETVIMPTATYQESTALAPAPFPVQIPPTPQFAQEGQLAIDVYHTPAEVIITAPVAGVKEDNLEVSITDDVLTIRGARIRDENLSPEELLLSECFWGDFSRSYPLPFQVVAEKAVDATLKDGVLTIRIPKLEAVNKKVIKIKSI